MRPSLSAGVDQHLPEIAFIPGEFFVGGRRGFHDHHFPKVGERHELIVHRITLPAPKPGCSHLILPVAISTHFMGPVANFLKAEHAVQVAVLADRRAPVVGNVTVAGDLVEFRRRELIAARVILQAPPPMS